MQFLSRLFSFLIILSDISNFNLLFKNDRICVCVIGMLLHFLLYFYRRISGLNEGRANKIIAYRQENSGFATRAEILKVPGIGKITFQQCSGFLTVLGSSEPLDTTIIHPESYGIAKA